MILWIIHLQTKMLIVTFISFLYHPSCRHHRNDDQLSSHLPIASPQESLELLLGTLLCWSSSLSLDPERNICQCLINRMPRHSRWLQVSNNFDQRGIEETIVRLRGCCWVKIELYPNSWEQIKHKMWIDQICWQRNCQLTRCRQLPKKDGRDCWKELWLR